MGQSWNVIKTCLGFFWIFLNAPRWYADKTLIPVSASAPKHLLNASSKYWARSEPFKECNLILLIFCQTICVLYNGLYFVNITCLLFSFMYSHLYLCKLLLQQWSILFYQGQSQIFKSHVTLPVSSNGVAEMSLGEGWEEWPCLPALFAWDSSGPNNFIRSLLANPQMDLSTSLHWDWSQWTSLV